MQFENHRRTALQYPHVHSFHWTLCRCQQYGAFSTKALAWYQVILLVRTPQAKIVSITRYLFRFRRFELELY